MAATDREQQILAWITQNPMISQNELADLCGITRSGVAAHISNLVKKGYLRGKGYIVAPPSYVAVIGGINLDIFGEAVSDIVVNSSNVGRITYALGGIARNVSFDLGRLDVPNYLISVYGDDYNGERFKADAFANAMDITYSKQLPHANTSTYLSITGPNGESGVALDDMSISDAITPAFLAEREHVIDNARAIVIDTSLTPEAIAWVCKHDARPIYARVVSVNKAARLVPNLSHLDTVVLSAAETGVLCGIETTDETSADQCADWLLKRGVRRVFLLLDGVGMLHRDAEHRWYLPLRHATHRHVNGAASGALSALVWSGLRDMDFEESSWFAASAAFATMECVESANPDFSEELLRQRREQWFG
ncbi:PfkB family carbohydrate kinase [Bifidobacterium oedipodis]|uniref:Carbohydrate kinase n=1 Tax=Bifidobacterium oedipodis TaxID=2675322 RepID=A0A7Y0EPI8_9BIFI|nr:PfkB family carbohydrate kinase [Bifidobacterium sp. DSM 109957]NMM94070.1 carbohydrate kinase [Bifidobacterium sp. DSM 109957]